MRKDIKDLKKFKGNEHGGLYALFPIDRKKTVKDIPKLEQHEVNVVAKFYREGQKELRVVLCRVDELPDFNENDQGDFIIDKIRSAKDNMVRENKVSKTGAERTVSDLIDKYIKEVLPSMNDGERYQQFLRELWEPEIGNMVLEDVTADNIRKVRNKLKDQGLAIATINRRVQPIKTAFSFASGGLESRGFDCVPKWIETDVTVSVKAWKENNKVERYLSEDELKRLREEIAKSESENLSDFFEFKLAAGCRWSEAMGLTWDNVDFDNKIITFKKVLTRSKFKGQKEVNGKFVNEYDHHVFRDGLKNGESSRVLDMSLYPEVLDRLRKRKFRHQKFSNDVFTADPKKAFRTALKRAEIKDFSFHTIRHTAMSYLAQEGATAFELNKSVERYAHLNAQLSKSAAEKMRRKIYGNG
jgi:integrase